MPKGHFSKGTNAKLTKNADGTWSDILSDGQTMLIDDIDKDIVEKWRLYVTHTRSGNDYASTGWGEYVERPPSTYVHRIIMMRMLGHDVPTKQNVDHINGNSLDNRRCNLRVVSHRVNICNQPNPRKNNHSGVSGVCLLYRNGKPKAWKGTWMTSDGRSTGKEFSIGIHGFERAKELAEATMKSERSKLPHYVEASKRTVERTTTTTTTTITEHIIEHSDK